VAAGGSKGGLNQLSPAVRRIATILALTIVSVGAYALVAVAPADAATPACSQSASGPT
jgi:hypothetical protein